MLSDLADKTIILGVLDLSTPEVEAAEVVADRARRAFDRIGPDEVVISRRLRDEVPAARRRREARCVR